MEIWKPIDDYPNYMISNYGEVKSLGNTKSKKEKKLKGIKGNDGYLRFGLYKDGELKMYLAHRLVAQAFIPNPNNKPFIDHINTIRTDNRVENLRWVTSSENMNNSITIEKLKQSKVSIAKKCLIEHLELIMYKNFFLNFRR